MSVQNIFALVVIVVSGCSAFVVPQNPIFDTIKGGSSSTVYESEECKASPTNLRITDSQPDGVTLLFDWDLKGECPEAGYFGSELFINGTRIRVSMSVSRTPKLRGMVLRNLEQGVVYKMVIRKSNTPKGSILIFDTGKIYSMETVEKRESFQEAMEELAFIQKSYELHSSAPACAECTNTTAPTNGRVSKVTHNSATIQYDWTHKKGDCSTFGFYAALYMETPIGVIRLTVSNFDVFFHERTIRGQVYVGLQEDTEYFTEVYSYSGNIRSESIIMKFRTQSKPGVSN